MRKWMRRLFIIGIAFYVLGALTSPSEAHAADPAVTPNADPASDDYSPRAWLSLWAPDSEQRTALPGDVKSGLEQTGMVFAVDPAQYSALTAADTTALAAQWEGGLLTSTYQRTTEWARAAGDATARQQPVPAWSPADSDAVARDLGATNYAALTPGLKSIVQRIATIVTGDFKPPMPDDAWSTWMTPAVKAAYTARPDTRFDWSKGATAVDPTASTIKTVCNAGRYNWLCIATRAAVTGAAAAAEFVTDPLAWLTGKIAAGASGLMGWIAGVANHATAPDLTADWWIDAYKKGMAIGVLVFGMVLLWQFVQRARGKIDAQDFMETLVIWTPAYFAGIIFGPPLAQFLIKGAGYLTDGIIASSTGFSAGDAADRVGEAITGAGAGTIIGGFFISLFLLIIVIIACFFIFVSLAAQAVTVYLASVVFGVAFAWVVSSRHRDGSMKIPLLFLGIVFSRPLLFFLLGVGMAITRSAIVQEGDDAAANLAILVMAVVVLCMAAFAPLLLLKFAPVSPAGMRGATGGAPAAMPGTGMRHPGAGPSRLSAMADSRSMRRSAAAGAAGAATGAAAGTPAAAGRPAGAPPAASAVPASGTSQAGKSATLGRQPRAGGGGTPSPSAGRVAGARPPGATAAARRTGAAARSTATAGRSLAAVGRQVGSNLSADLDGHAEWEPKR